MNAQPVRHRLFVLAALLIVSVLLFGTAGPARAESDPAWQVIITAQLPAEQVAALGGPEQAAAALFTQASQGVQALSAQTRLESLGMSLAGLYGYRLTVQGSRLDSFRQAVWACQPNLVCWAG